MSEIYVTKESHNDIKWVCAKQRVEQEKPTDEQKKKGVRPKPIPDITILNIALIDYSSVIERVVVGVQDEIAKIVKEAIV